MIQPIPLTPGSENLILASDLSTTFGDSIRLRRLVGRGELHRVARGLYFKATDWNTLDADQRYALRVRGASLERRGEVALSHQSAAVLWGLPLLVPWPDDVHFLTERATGGRSDPGIRRHALGVDAQDVTVIDGLLVTTVARTVIDLAATVDLKSAVAAADRALFQDRYKRYQPWTTKAKLIATWERMLPFRGSARARAVIDFATSLSGSALESASRVNIALSGFPEPELQRVFIIDGLEYDTDFYWLAHDAVGEADGRGKYFDPRMLAGKTTAQAVMQEKDREDAIRREVSAFTRWDRATGVNQYRLRSRLLQLGLPTGRPRLRSS